MNPDTEDLVLYLTDFKADYLAPIQAQYTRRDLLPEDKRKVIVDRYHFLRGFVEQIEKLLEEKIIEK